MKKLIINADDFGLTVKVNEAILDGHHQGVISSTSLLANGDAFESAVSLSRQAPALGVGIHLNLTEGRPAAPRGAVPNLVDRQGYFARKPASLWRAIILSGIKMAEIEKEFCAQIEKVRRAGIVPTHLDSHKHIHALPPLGRMTLELAHQYGIPAVRCPVEPRTILGCLIQRYPRRTPAILRQFANACVLAIVSRAWSNWPRSFGIAHPIRLYGMTATGFLDEHVLREILSHIPEGISELMCHPGYVDSALKRTPTRLLNQRDIEYRALTQPAIKLLIQERGIELVSYRDAFWSKAGASPKAETNLTACLRS